jgi:hypothetical protein
MLSGSAWLVPSIHLAVPQKWAAHPTRYQLLSEGTSENDLPPGRVRSVLPLLSTRLASRLVLAEEVQNRQIKKFGLLPVGGVAGFWDNE